MKHKLLLSIALASMVTLMSGCGSSNLEDQFTFGTSRVHCENATVSVSAPFELVVNGKQADLGDKSAEKVNAEGHNRNIQILVTADKAADGTTPASLADDAVNMLKSDSLISNLKSDRSKGKVDGQDAEVINFTFTEKNKGVDVDLSIREYIFSYKDVNWRVIYQYRTDDETGKALADKLAGQVKMGTTF